MDYTDLVFYDIKHMESAVHKELTGVSNEQILKNIEASLNLTKVPIIIRIPVIPGHNDSKENTEATARFVKELGAKEVNLLPYHRLGIGKYVALGIKCPLGEDILPHSDTEIEKIKSIYESYNLSCSVGG